MLSVNLNRKPPWSSGVPFEILKALGGADKTLIVGGAVRDWLCDEPIGDIEVQYSELKPINISGEKISTLIDELPILFIACATCKGISEFHDIEELRFKESDRIKSMERKKKLLKNIRNEYKKVVYKKNI